VPNRIWIDSHLLLLRGMTQNPQRVPFLPQSNTAMDSNHAHCGLRGPLIDSLDEGVLVDLIGIEPMTSSMPWKRAPSCATGPLLGRT
jgi:hypothetical protein